jgi:hypothetical protein
MKKVTVFAVIVALCIGLNGFGKMSKLVMTTPLSGHNEIRNVETWRRAGGGISAAGRTSGNRPTLRFAEVLKGSFHSLPESYTESWLCDVICKS